MTRYYYLIFSESHTSYISIREKDKDKDFYSFNFTSTHPKTIDWLIGSIKRSHYELGAVSTLPSGEKYSVNVKIDYKEPDDMYLIQKLKWWFLSKLGQLGWEAFAIEKPDPPIEFPFEESKLESLTSSTLGIIHFRKKEEVSEYIEKKTERE